MGTVLQRDGVVDLRVPIIRFLHIPGGRVKVTAIADSYKTLVNGSRIIDVLECAVDFSYEKGNPFVSIFCVIK